MTCEPPPAWYVSSTGPQKSRTSSSSRAVTSPVRLWLIKTNRNKCKQRPSSCCHWSPVNQQGKWTAGACNDGSTTSKKNTYNGPTINELAGIFVPYLQSFKSHQSHCSILNNLLTDVPETSLGVKCGRICCDRYKHWVMRAPKLHDSAVIMLVCRPSGSGYDKNDLLRPKT